MDIYTVRRAGLFFYCLLLRTLTLCLRHALAVRLDAISLPRRKEMAKEKTPRDPMSLESLQCATAKYILPDCGAKTYLFNARKPKLNKLGLAFGQKALHFSPFPRFSNIVEKKGEGPPLLAGAIVGIGTDRPGGRPLQGAGGDA